MTEANEEIEALQLKLESEVCSLAMEALVEFAQQIEVDSEGLRRIQLSKEVRQKIEANLEKSGDKKALLEGYITMVTPEPPPLETLDETSDEENQGNQDGAQTNKTDSENSSNPSKDLVNKLNVDLVKALKRDFKIIGVIGGGKQKDSLSFVSLSRQIETGIKSGYKESVVIEAVIRAVSPSLKLRSYLEMINDMSLVRLKQILRAHFKEKTGTELYQELTSLCQGPKESAQDFLVRAMNLREQVTFASQADDSVVKFGKPQVQSLFLHVVETGMQQESIRAKLRPLLEKPGVTDEELMEKVNVAVSAETERHNKMTSVKKGAQVNQVVTNQEPSWPSQNDSDDSTCNKKKSAKSRRNLTDEDKDMLTATLKSVQTDLASLKEAFNRSQVSQGGADNGPSRSQQKQKKAQCDSCKQSGEQVCDHCFKCGSSEHFARGCKKNQGNGKGLRPRDRK